MKKQFIATLVVLVLSSLVFGQNSRMGTSSSTQLLIIPGARYLSGGGARFGNTGLVDGRRGRSRIDRDRCA